MLINCKILIAKSAGFCFGVDRAVKIVYNKLNDYEDLVTLGPLIHNNNVVEDLKAKGVVAVDRVSQIKDGQPVVIRSHGVDLKTYESLEAKNVEIIDATCPFVERIHKIAHDYSKEGYSVLIAGDPNHPEVIGIKGHCVNKAYVFSDEEELKVILEKLDKKNNVAIVSQTTFNVSVWESCVKIINNNLPTAKIFNTICNATAERQREAAELAQKVDIMIIVGGRHSSNTLKLKQVCDNYCKCYLIEGADEIKNLDFSNSHFIGISAGASTPAYIIKEVQQTMSDFLTTDEEFNFEEALEQSFKKIYTGAKVTGYITTVNNSEVTVDIGTKHTGIIPASELTDDPNLKPEDIVKPGDEIEVIVLKISDQDGLVTLSKKKVDAAKGFEKILTAKEENTILSGVVTNVVKGGILVSTNGVKIFIPASHATSRRDDKLEELLKKNVEFKIIDVNEARQRAVGSIRVVAKEARDAAQAKFFEA
ncbi:MAG: 4-hydroxy-3-methylbut-2-enyl diphosphate reductase, partial [Clostridiales bacterium]|nr:4-hydroxy-3-methylbut-2-enyl diphosphate reductase [Clostridiales bacterium]